MTTQWVDTGSGRLAFDVVGEGPLIVLCPGMGDTRATYRFLAPQLLAAGYRVATVDLRGHGESSVEWPSFSRTDTATDLIAVVEALGGPAVIIGQSFSGGSATIIAATRPDLVIAVVEIAPFTRPPAFSLGAFVRNDHGYRRGALRLGRFAITKKVSAWSGYLDVAYPTRKPSDWDAWLADVEANLSEAGRMGAVQAMIRSKPVDAAASLAGVDRPTLIVMGAADSDFADPAGEAAAIVDLLPSGVGQSVIIDDAGHYPHAEFPDEVAAAITAFLHDHTSA